MLDTKFLKFIRDENKLLGKRRDTGGYSYQDALISMTKLTEEVGELAEQILASGNLQRSGKNLKADDEALAKELADVIIVACLIGDTFKIDLTNALEQKMIKIEQRHKENDV